MSAWLLSQPWVCPVLRSGPCLASRCEWPPQKGCMQTHAVKHAFESCVRAGPVLHHRDQQSSCSLQTRLWNHHLVEWGICLI